MIRRFCIGALALCASVLLAPGAAWAQSPSAVTIAGPGIAGTLTVTDAHQQDQFQTLLNLVSWMADAPGDPMTPDTGSLGDRYTLTLMTAGTPVTRIDLYPHAQGGPRAFRPGHQPDGRVRADAWFYASVMTPSRLAAAGVPVSGVKVDSLTSPLDVHPVEPSVAWHKAMGLFRRDFLLSVAVGILMSLVLAGIARRISRLGL
jgi:hypothetical protein